MSVINAVSSGSGEDATHGVQLGVGIAEILVQTIKLIFAGVESLIPASESDRQIIMQFSYFGAALSYILF